MERSAMREKSPGFPPAFAGVHPGYDARSRRREKQMTALHIGVAGM
jgi:hypothetical protein